MLLVAKLVVEKPDSMTMKWRWVEIHVDVCLLIEAADLSISTYSDVAVGFYLNSCTFQVWKCNIPTALPSTVLHSIGMTQSSRRHRKSKLQNLSIATVGLWVSRSHRRYRLKYFTRMSTTSTMCNRPAHPANDSSFDHGPFKAISLFYHACPRLYIYQYSRSVVQKWDFL